MFPLNKKRGGAAVETSDVAREGIGSCRNKHRCQKVCWKILKFYDLQLLSLGACLSAGNIDWAKLHRNLLWYYCPIIVVVVKNIQTRHGMNEFCLLGSQSHGPFWRRKLDKKNFCCFPIFISEDNLQTEIHRVKLGALYLERSTALCLCHGVFTDKSIFSLNSPRTGIPTEALRPITISA